MFDVFNEDKITEAGLFKFMEDASLRRADLQAAPTTLLALHETENDIFLEVFSDTYAKILEALSNKQKRQAQKLLNDNLLKKKLQIRGQDGS